jgi:hypothetical protein
VQLGGNGEELGPSVLPLSESLKIGAAHKVGRFLEWHHLIRNSLQGSSGNRWCAAKVKVGFLFCGVTE